MRISLRDANSRDLDFLLELNNAVVPAVNELDGDAVGWFLTHAPYARLAELDATPAGFLFGLTHENDYASANFAWFRERFPEFVYVDRVAVAEPARRAGVARALYDDFMRHAGGRSRVVCEVNIRPRNERSLRFHARLGFEQVGTREDGHTGKRLAMLSRALP
ncbi:MAG: GNAT family N-acetyltransferase [Gammaproteobacteria bacterium]|jgi:predicted GNAT superfamily acetyltransferase